MGIPPQSWSLIQKQGREYGSCFTEPKPGTRVEEARRQQLEAIQPCEVVVRRPALCEAMAKESAALASGEGSRRPLPPPSLRLHIALDQRKYEEVLAPYIHRAEFLVFEEAVCDNAKCELLAHRTWLVRRDIHTVQGAPRVEWVLNVWAHDGEEGGEDGVATFCQVLEKDIPKVLGEDWQQYQSEKFQWRTSRWLLEDSRSWLDVASWFSTGKNHVYHVFTTTDPDADAWKLAYSEEDVTCASKALAYAFHVEPNWFEQTPALTASERAATRRSLERYRVSSEPFFPEANVSTAEEYFKMLMGLSSIDSEDSDTESEC